MNTIARVTKRPPYWLIVRESHVPLQVFIIGLPDVEGTLPIFSFGEEAEMFLQLQGLQDEWRVRQTTPGELRSLFYTVLRGIERVTLDPIPEISCMGNSGLPLSVYREDFLARLEGTDDRGEFVEKRAARPTVLNEPRPAQRLG